MDNAPGFVSSWTECTGVVFASSRVHSLNCLMKPEEDCVLGHLFLG